MRSYPHAPSLPRPRCRVAALLLAGALTACGGRPAVAQPAPPNPGGAHAYLYEVSPEQAAGGAAQEQPFIEVSGTASVTVAPDRVAASFAVETRAPTAAEASTANAELMDRVVRALRATAVAGLEIETYGYTLRPEYRYVDGEPARGQLIDGYTALNNIRVKASDVSAAGRLLDTAIQAGANRVSSLGFEASDTEAARRDALAQAVRSATMQARVMAEALGRTLGSPLEVRGGAENPYPRGVPDVMFRAEATMARATPIEAGDLTVSATVTVRFALGGTAEGR